MKRIRVLFVTNMFPSAGSPASGIFVEQQIEGLRRAGVAGSVLFLDRVRDGRRAYAGIPRKLAKALASQPVDLVHAMYGGVMASRVARAGAVLSGPPVIVTFHGSDLQGAAGSGPLTRLSAAYGVRCSRDAARRAAGVVVVAPHLASRLPHGIPPERVRVIPCGIDLERFRPIDTATCRRTLGWSEDRFHVLFATNNDDPVKRPELAREAVRRLESKGHPVELHVLRGVPNAEVPVWLNASDAVLLTSHQEGSPTIVKEALACGRPVVSVRVGDVPARIGGVRGCHLADADPVALAGGLEAVMAGPPTVDPRAAADQSLEAAAERLLDFYESVLMRYPARAPRESRPVAPVTPVAPAAARAAQSAREAR